MDEENQSMLDPSISMYRNKYDKNSNINVAVT